MKILRRRQKKNTRKKKSQKRLLVLHIERVNVYTRERETSKDHHHEHDDDDDRAKKKCERDLYSHIKPKGNNSLFPKDVCVCSSCIALKISSSISIRDEEKTKREKINKKLSRQKKRKKNRRFSGTYKKKK